MYKMSSKLVESPPGRWCNSGHVASESFNNAPTQFFQITCNVLKGIYCEPCLILANFISKNKESENK